MRKPFHNYISREEVERILNSPPPSPTVGRAEFVLILLRDEPLERVPERAGRLYELARRAGGHVEPFVGSLAMIFFPQPSPPGRRQACIESIAREMGPDVAMLHGESRLLSATCGELSTMILEGLPRMLAMLSAEMRLGEVREWVGS